MKITIKIKFAALGTHRDYYGRRPCGSARETLNASAPPPPCDVPVVECVRVRTVARASVYVPALHAGHYQLLPLLLYYPSVITTLVTPSRRRWCRPCVCTSAVCARVCVCVRYRLATSRWPWFRPPSGTARASSTPPNGQSPSAPAVVHRRRAWRSSHTGSRCRTTRTPNARGLPAVGVVVTPVRADDMRTATLII